jgi:hypothetical protein
MELDEIIALNVGDLVAFIVASTTDAVPGATLVDAAADEDDDEPLDALPATGTGG